ncbi:DUF2798 domain-containing protein [Marinobacterium arenosum]|uniref:DUF2798 domain-containing protein n=1 Tax=Marinobacterium arenosum TaxID=2862496 RepID=UPI001C98DFB0|nr:DUF2798 domain-containing protein [Marinobacterium arenosum]MBY4676455.1 DUF2798 domain-containing protein [Marinobacterium arenosum]
MKFRLCFAFLLSLVLSFLMTAWVTWLNLGFTADFISRWLSAFITAWPAAALISFTLAPSVQRLTRYLVNFSDNGKGGGRNAEQG